MRIEHSPLFNEFLSYWFETSVDGEKLYETVLDYTLLKWWTETISFSPETILSGNINRTEGLAAEKNEEERIRNIVTAHLLKS